jgi:hypothetical protein
MGLETTTNVFPVSRANCEPLLLTTTFLLKDGSGRIAPIGAS